jgi:hypothetical protein
VKFDLKARIEVLKKEVCKGSKSKSKDNKVKKENQPSKIKTQVPHRIKAENKQQKHSYWLAK